MGARFGSLYKRRYESGVAELPGSRLQVGSPPGWRHPLFEATIVDCERVFGRHHPETLVLAEQPGRRLPVGSEQAVDYVCRHLSGETSANPGGHFVIGQPGQAGVLLGQQDIDDHPVLRREPRGQVGRDEFLPRK
jgi:hypothetical protein